MGQATEPSAEQQWDAWATSDDSLTATETETEPTDGLAAETEADETQDTPAASNDFESLRAEMNALKQQIEQERTQAEERLRRAQQSFRSVGDSIIARVEQRLTPITATYEGLVRDGMLTPEDAERRISSAQRQIQREETQRDAQAQNQATYQQWLAQQQGSMSAQQTQSATNGRTIDAQTAKEVQDEIIRIVGASGLSADELALAGMPADLSHLSPVAALKTTQTYVMAAKRLKLIASGRMPGAPGTKQFSFPDMGGGAGVAARGEQGITRELDAEMAKANPDFDRITELRDALNKY